VNNIKLDPPVSYGSYGLDMVRAAVAEARKALAAMAGTVHASGVATNVRTYASIYVYLDIPGVYTNAC